MTDHAAHAVTAAPVGGKYVTPTTVVLAGLTLAGFYYIALRFIYGLGAVTNLNDGYPWGIWIAYDVVIGTAFACGGYAMALLVYIFNKGRYHPLVRPALLASLFGYSLGGASVILDLGRWWNVWHMYWPGYAQPNSVMFEVALCISGYIIVLWIEFTPAFLERFGLNRTRRVLDKVLFAVIALGVLLPSMHQSSLGTLMVVFGHQVHPLWQTVLLPVLYLASAIAMGFSIVIFEATLASSGFRRPRETELLGRMSKVIVGLVAFNLALRLGDIWVRGEAPRILAGDFLSRMFLVEMALFALPLLLLATSAGRASARCLFVAAVGLLLGGSLYRLDTFLVAYNPGDEWSYFPSAPEIMVTLGIISLEILAYNVFVKFFPVLHAAEGDGGSPSR